MTKNNKYANRKSCFRKTKYDKKEAEEQLIRKMLHSGDGGSIYSCSNCGWWHITKQPKEVK